MDIVIHRDLPAPPPPISDVVIYLSPYEAERLMFILGHLSFNDIMDMDISQSTSQAEDVNHFVADLYGKLERGFNNG